MHVIFSCFCPDQRFHLLHCCLAWREWRSLDSLDWLNVWRTSINSKSPEYVKFHHSITLNFFSFLFLADNKIILFNKSLASNGSFGVRWDFHTHSRVHTDRVCLIFPFGMVGPKTLHPLHISRPFQVPKVPFCLKMLSLLFHRELFLKESFISKEREDTILDIRVLIFLSIFTPSSGSFFHLVSFITLFPLIRDDIHLSFSETGR